MIIVFTNTEKEINEINTIFVTLNILIKPNKLSKTLFNELNEKIAKTSFSIE